MFQGETYFSSLKKNNECFVLYNINRFIIQNAKYVTSNFKIPKKGKFSNKKNDREFQNLGIHILSVTPGSPVNVHTHILCHIVGFYEIFLQEKQF